jgi:hypothetical protein
MQLRTARLCLDCEEIYDSQQCPVCASEAFAYVTRWVPVPERRARPRGPSPEHAAVYRELLTENKRPNRPLRMLRTGAIGLAAFGLIRYALQRSQSDSEGPQASSNAPDQMPAARPASPQWKARGGAS